MKIIYSTNGILLISGTRPWHFMVRTRWSVNYASKIHGKVAATSASMVNIASRKKRHRVVVQILRLRLRWGGTAVITILSASSSAMGLPSALMMKIWDALWLGLINRCRRSRSQILLKQWKKHLTARCCWSGETRCASWSRGRVRGRGTSRVCASLFPPESPTKDTNVSFCFLTKVRCRHMGHTIVSLMIPSLLMQTSVFTRQSWQNTWPQHRVLSVSNRHS